MRRQMEEASAQTDGMRGNTWAWHAKNDKNRWRQTQNQVCGTLCVLGFRRQKGERRWEGRKGAERTGHSQALAVIVLCGERVVDELVRQLVLGIHRVVGGMGEKGRRVDLQ